MAGTIQCGRRVRKDFGKIPSIVEIPNLIEIQHRSYEQFLQKDVAPERREEAGLQGVFTVRLPDRRLQRQRPAGVRQLPLRGSEVHGGGVPGARHDLRHPAQGDAAAGGVRPDKEAKTRSIREQRGQEVYLGELPLMTEKGTFIINGTERVVVEPAPALGRRVLRRRQGQDPRLAASSLFSARVIPYRGSWVEFEFDANDILHVRVDRRRKMLATAFLRAFWFLEKGMILSDEEILALFYDLEDVSPSRTGRRWVKLTARPTPASSVADDVARRARRPSWPRRARPLTPKLIEKRSRRGIEQIPVRAEALVGPPLAWARRGRGDGRGAGRGERRR